MSGVAELAIELPVLEPGAQPPPLPCQVLDSRLRPTGTFVADGHPHIVSAGWLVLLITLPSGPRRINVALHGGGSYRLYVHGSQPAESAELADVEALQTMKLLEAGRVAEAVELAERRLPAIKMGQLGDPVAIAAVAYALIQAFDRERLGAWCLDLADQHPKLSDGFVIGAEWHALAGNHLTALNYLHRLGGDAPPPLFALGITRAIDRLAGYRALRVVRTPSERLRSSDLPKGSAAGQLLNRWDVEGAGGLYDDLLARWGQRPRTSVLTSRIVAPAPTGARVLMATSERALVRRLAGATSTKHGGDHVTERRRVF